MFAIPGYQAALDFATAILLEINLPDNAIFANMHSQSTANQHPLGSSSTEPQQTYRACVLASSSTHAQQRGGSLAVGFLGSSVYHIYQHPPPRLSNSHGLTVESLVESLSFFPSSLFCHSALRSPGEEFIPGTTRGMGVGNLIYEICSLSAVVGLSEPVLQLICHYALSADVVV